MIAVLSSQRDPIAGERSEEGRTNASNCGGGGGAERGRSGERDESKGEKKEKRGEKEARTMAVDEMKDGCGHTYR